MKSEQRPDNRHEGEADRSVSQSVARALSVLDLLADSGEDIGVREIARRLKLAPSITQRLLATLAAGGYVERAPDEKEYRIGLRAFEVGRVFLAKTDLRESSLPELRAMAERDKVNAFLGVLRDRSMVYIEALQSHAPIAIRSSPGYRGPLHSTAFGKALLAELSDQEVTKILGPAPFPALTGKTKTTLSALLKDLKDVRRLGYAISDQENIENVFAVGTVVRDANGHAIAAISGAVPRNQLNRQSRENLCHLVTGAAERISRRLGAHGKPDPVNPIKSITQERSIRC
jgi:DNA-binding IclR family transcriptional regulator